MSDKLTEGAFLPAPYQFEGFQLDVTRFELRRNGHVLKLERIPMELLILLVSRQGELVSREEIIAKLWGQDVFIETEHGINTAVRKIRQTLGDNSERSRFVQTVVGKGYRFIATVRSSAAVPVPQTQTEEERRKPSTVHRDSRRLILIVAAVPVLLAGLVGLRKNSAEPSLEMAPLTALNGWEFGPSFSPDGNQVAFALRGSDNSGIYTALVGGEKSLRLTNNPSDRYPAWSPNGREIAFARASEEGQAIFLIPALGGTEHRIYTGPATVFPWSLSWSPSGESLAFSESRPDRTNARISWLSLSDFSVRPLTFPSDQDLDYAPAFSPDGSTLAFVRSVVTGRVSDLYIVSVKGGQPKRLTFSNRAIWAQLAWTADGGEIVFCSDPSGVTTLWRVSVSGGVPRPIEGVGAGACMPAVSRGGDRLAYQHSFTRYSIRRLNLNDAAHGNTPPVEVVSAKGLSKRPDFSPDGRKISFESDRLGYQDIWVCNSDGSNCGQLASQHAESGAARWSPDGRHIAFEVRPKDHSEIFLVDLPEGHPRLLPTLPGSDNGGPNWSRDGKWIYFYSDKGGGPLQLWKVPAKGGAPVQITSNGGVYAFESVDRQFLYFSKWGAPGIWKMPIDGGPETQVLDQPDSSDWFNWGITRRGIYYLDSHAKPATISFLEFPSGAKFPIYALMQKPGSGLAVSTDGNQLVYSQVDLAESSIMLVKNFH